VPYGSGDPILTPICIWADAFGGAIKVKAKTKPNTASAIFFDIILNLHCSLAIKPELMKKLRNSNIRGACS
jgi:hypothetical protein